MSVCCAEGNSINQFQIIIRSATSHNLTIGDLGVQQILLDEKRAVT